MGRIHCQSVGGNTEKNAFEVNPYTSMIHIQALFSFLPQTFFFFFGMGTKQIEYISLGRTLSNL